MKDKEESYTVDELQEMWGVTKRRLIKYILEGKLKGKRIDKRHAYRVSKKDAEEFLKSGLIKSS
ncbi:MAG: helix-turn-helix domain-containing protein [Bacilli bacterium]